MRCTERMVLAAFCLLLAVFGWGCEPAATTSVSQRTSETQTSESAGRSQTGTTSSQSVASPTSAATENGTEKKTSTPGFLEETWDVCTIGDTKVGYTHTTIEAIREAGQECRRIVVENELRLTRFKEQTVQQMSMISIETTSGELMRFESKVTAGREVTLSRGVVDGDQLKIEVTTPGKTQASTIPWDKSVGSFFAGEQSLRKKPLKPGEKRKVTNLQPILNVISETQFEALVIEATRLSDRTEQLLKVRKVDVIGETKIESFHWVNVDGESLKSFIPALQLTTQRTTQEAALATADRGSYDLGDASIVPVARSLNAPHATQRIVYRAKLKDGEFDQRFPTSASQVVSSDDNKSVTITVNAIRPDRPKVLEKAETPPTDDDLAANNYIQSDHASITELANETMPGEEDAWTLASGLERAVFRLIRKKNFSQALATAAEVAESREGDCTEHAVLLAALCRARKIPARVAIGLIYYQPAKGFAYHMWTEAWIADRWVPLDATLGHGGIGAAHIKIATSNLAGASSLSPFLPVANLIGRLQLEIVEVN